MPTKPVNMVASADGECQSTKPFDTDDRTVAMPLHREGCLSWSGDAANTPAGGDRFHVTSHPKRRTRRRSDPPETESPLSAIPPRRRTPRGNDRPRLSHRSRAATTMTVALLVLLSAASFGHYVDASKKIALLRPRKRATAGGEASDESAALGAARQQGAPAAAQSNVVVQPKDLKSVWTEPDRDDRLRGGGAIDAAEGRAGTTVVLRPRNGAAPRTKEAGAALDDGVPASFRRPALSLRKKKRDTERRGESEAPRAAASTAGEAQPLASTSDAGDEVVVYYYDAADSSSAVDAAGSPVLSIPDVVYDEAGKTVPLAKVHDGGKNEVYMEHNPGDLPPPPPTPPIVVDEAVSVDSSNSTSRRTTEEKRHVNPADWENMGQAQDQMIIVSTVATMALLVGALSARRLRSRQFLNSCIENESLEDELAYDTAYTHPAMGGGLMGGPRGSGYDTFASTAGGSLPWKGDLEKFDV